MERFRDRNVIVTGAGRGIGEATARRFASEGADVLLVGRTPEPLEDVASAIQGDGGRRGLHTADVGRATRSTPAWPRRSSAGAASTSSINNAGIDDETPFLQMDEARWREVVDINLTGCFLMGQRVAREMQRTGGGAIVHNASIDASRRRRAVRELQRLEGRPARAQPHDGPGARRARHPLNCVSPGFTHTDMTERAVGPKMMEYLNGQFARVPMRRLVRTEEVAAAFAFLASDDASGITGVDLRVDCGLTANWFILETLPEL